MRAGLVLVVALWSLAAGAAEDLDFDLAFQPGMVIGSRLVIPVELSLPIEQLRFVDDGTELVARFSILAITGTVERTLGEPHRIAVPRGTLPQGTGTYRFDLLPDRGVNTITIAVRDDSSGLTGTQSVAIEGTRAHVAAPVADDNAWKDALARAQTEKKPLVVFYRSAPCSRCREFERITVPHPTIQRRMPAVVFATLPAEKPGVAFFDRAGVLRARWPIVPDTTNFGIILDSIVAVAPHFERAVQLFEAGAAQDAEREAAIGLVKLGFPNEARAALARAGDRAKPDPPPPAAPKAEVAEAPQRGAIRILPLARQVVSGRHLVRTSIASAAIARVAFSLDGRDVARIERPPFSATLDFGAVPERRSIRAVAFDRQGRELGRDERIVNEAGETFWLRLMTPREGWVSGATRVSMNVRAPVARHVRRVVVSWNDARRAVLTAAPWDATINIPEGQLGVLRAVAELDDGRNSEDAVLLNAGGMVGQADVQLVELPITVVSRTGITPEITAERITVREGKTVRRVESVAGAAETPLTVGLLIDVSDSMQRTLPDLQEAAIRFLETALGERDRAFLVTFDSAARLLQPATSDVALLRRQIMKIRPNGLTALHDAMVLGLLQFEGIKGRRAMIVFTDGLDRTSEYTAAEVSELARRANVPVHVFASLSYSPYAGGTWIASPSNPDLQRIAQATGGTAHTLKDLAELPAIYARIEAALRAQILAFVRTDPGTRENEWRSIKVQVSGPDLDVFAPEGYYAAW